MSGAVKVSEIKNPSDIAVPVDDVVYGTARAWVNFNGTGTVAIRDDYNVSSITDNGTGNYTINFTNSLSNGDYAVAAFAGWHDGTSVQMAIGVRSNSTRTTSAVQVETYNVLASSMLVSNSPEVCVTIFCNP